jgi:hypothetical protein
VRRPDGPAETRAVDVDEVVKHTDSGSGASQAEHWDANVSMPDDEAWEGDDIRDDGGPETGGPALSGNRIDLTTTFTPFGCSKASLTF